MNLRRAERADIHQLIPLLNDLDQMHQVWHPDMFVPLPEGRTTDDVLDLLKNPEGEVWVAESEGAVTGLVYLEHREFKDLLVVRERKFILVDMLVVDARRRGEGIGKMLMEKAKEVAVENGCSELQLKVMAGNAQARGWYEGLGYEPMLSQMWMRLDGGERGN